MHEFEILRLNYIMKYKYLNRYARMISQKLLAIFYIRIIVSMAEKFKNLLEISQNVFAVKSCNTCFCSKLQG